MLLTQSDLDICARTVWGEARGEGYLGMKAVAHVMINRWQSRDGQFARDDTLATACLRHKQFSVWNMGDPNFGKMFEVDYGNAQLLDAMHAALSALRGGDDITFGSCHYHHKSISPPWAEGKTPVARIYGHHFYNDID